MNSHYAVSAGPFLFHKDFGREYGAGFIRRTIGVLILFVVFGTATRVNADTATGAPHFTITSEVTGADPLPLKENRAHINIAGVIAHVHVTQVYRNDGKVPLEAIYVFPGSTNAAVFGMKMQVGKRVTFAKMHKRSDAKRQYGAAKRVGNTASLLEEHRPNVFQMTVTNILPGDEIKIELDYTEILIPEGGIYEFVYPAVVGPRYSGEQTSGETWHKSPYLSEGESPRYQFELTTTLSTGMAIQHLTSPSHTGFKPTLGGANTASLQLTKPTDGDRDFILRYQLRGNAIETGILRYQGEAENFFLLMVQPPKRITPTDMPAREYVFLVDVSGSTSGFSLALSKTLIFDLLRGMRPKDRFNIVFFANGSYQLNERSVPASKDNVGLALQVLSERRDGGGTNLLAALRKAFAMPTSQSTARTIILITDGGVNVDPEAFRLVKKNVNQASVFAFGIGSAVNRHLMQGMARAGQGEAFIIVSQEEASRKAAQFRRLIQSPALTNIKLEFKDFSPYDIEPQVVPDLRGQRPILLYGKYRGNPGGSITVSGTTGKGAFRQIVQIAEAIPKKEHQALRHLWAQSRIHSLMDLQRFTGEYTKGKIVALAQKYQLLTEFTSFVAVDSHRKNRVPSSMVQIHQPLALPEHVTRHASELRPAPVRDRDLLPDDDDDDDDAPREMQERVYAQGNPNVGDVSDIHSSSVSARTMAPFQLSIGHRVALDDQSTSLAFSMPILVRVGIVRNVELRLGSSVVSASEGEFAIPDLRMGAKILLAKHRNIALGTIVEAALDVTDHTPQQLTARMAMLLEVPLWPRAILRMDLGLAAVKFRSQDPQYGVGYGAELFQNVGSWIPFVGVHGIARDVGTASVEAGIGRHISRILDIGLSASKGITEPTGDAAFLYLRWKL